MVEFARWNNLKHTLAGVNSRNVGSLSLRKYYSSSKDSQAVLTTHGGVLTTRDAFFSVNKCKNCYTVFYIRAFLLVVVLTIWDLVYRSIF